MNWEAVQAIANSALVLTSGGAIAYAGRQLRHERDYRSVSNLEKQLAFFLGDSFGEVRRHLAEVRLNGDTLVPLQVEDPPAVAVEVLDFYDHLGLLVRKGHLDLHDVWHTFYEWAQPVYIDLQPIVDSDQSPYHAHYAYLRKLMREMDDIQIKRMHEKHDNHWALWTPDRILDHYRYELEVSQGPRRPRRIRARTAPSRQTVDHAGAEGQETEGNLAGRK